MSPTDTKPDGGSGLVEAKYQHCCPSLFSYTTSDQSQLFALAGVEFGRQMPLCEQNDTVFITGICQWERVLALWMKYVRAFLPSFSILQPILTMLVFKDNWDWIE